MNIEIIFGTPSLVKALIFSGQGILEVLPFFLRIQKEESIILRTNILTFFFLLYVFVHYPITLSILAFQLPLASMTASHYLCHLLTPYMTMY